MICLKNGKIYDGTAAAPITGSVLLDDGGRIAATGAAVAAPVDCQVLDCTGMAIAPGFIDLHSHSDLQAMDTAREEKIKQGVTTEVVGNCGFSPFPHCGDVGQLIEFGGGILGRNDGWGWATAREYLDAMAASPGPVHAAPLAGHGSLRVAVAGMRQGPLTALEADRMAGLLGDALDAGCAGFSTGLMYAPGSSADLDELVPLCRIVARKGKLYATHMRNYMGGLVESVDEQLEIARRSGCRLQISHLQAAGRGNWGFQQGAIERIESARASGVDVEFDIYPYQCGSTVLTQWLPDWAMDGGRHALLARLRDPATRKRIAEDVDARRAQEWTDVTISAVATEANAGLVGRTIAEAAEIIGREGADAALELLDQEDAAVNVVSFNQSEENLRQLLTHPLCSVISDGFYVKGKPHPRLHGTFPELLGSVVRERGWMTLETAIHKITAKPAARLGLATGGGSVRPGAPGDVTVFDPAHVASRATYQDPASDPIGIVAVIRNGRVVHAPAAN
jgi:N-acyl-D-amino-acid deacylase